MGPFIIRFGIHTHKQRKFVELKNAVIKAELFRCLNSLASTEKISVVNDMDQM